MELFEQNNIGGWVKQNRNDRSKFHDWIIIRVGMKTLMMFQFQAAQVLIKYKILK